ncbi:MAG TPA: DUF4386 family protein [Actinomycetes bacterium]|nr:DUF4386 family protein [Actinomycetes bacterium]
MSSRSLERGAAGSGLVFVVLQLAARLVVPRPVLPEVQPGGLVRSYYLDHRSLLGVRGVLTGLAVVCGLVFLGALFHVLRRDSELPWLAPVALAGGVGALACSLVATSALAALVEFRQAEVLAPTQSSAGGALALFRLYDAFDRFAGYPLLALVAATSVGVLASRQLPRWFGWAGVALAAVVLLDLTTPLPLREVAFYAFLAWVAVASLLFALDPRSSDSTEAATLG